MARFFSLRTCSAPQLLFAAMGLAVILRTVAGAEEIDSADRKAPATVRLYEAEGTERRLLDRFQRYLNRQQWDDAFECAAKLLPEDRPTVVAVGDHRSVSTSEYVHQQLAKLPPEALAEYRDLVDAPAGAWTRQGIAEHDRRLLRQVVDQFFCSHWGDDALFALGELALEQGDYQAARRHWGRISSKLQFFDGPVPSEQPTLAYPDTDLSLAQVSACLALVSLYEGDLARAKNEIETLSATYGTAVGRLGGHEVVLAQALTNLLQQAKSWQPRPIKNDWPTYAGSPARTNARTNARSLAQKLAYKKLWSRPLGAPSETSLALFPVVLGELLLFQNASQVEALRLNTGERAFVSAGDTFQSSPQSSTGEEVRSASASYTLAGGRHRVFGTTDPPLATGSASIWGIDLQRDGALSFQQRPENGSLRFAGAPVVVGDRLWVAVRSSRPTLRAGIACYDLATGKQTWQRWICRANIPATGQPVESTTNLLTYDSDTLYFCTNLGAIAATRSDDGHPLWIATYERSAAPTTLANDLFSYLSSYHGPNPSVFSRGMLFVLPTDSQTLLALDATTGLVRWRYKRASPAAKILGVAADRLLVSDAGLRTFDLRTGDPKLHQQELQLAGHPVIIGKTLYWPTEREILTVDIATGDWAAQTLRLPESGGANLLVAGEYLVAAGPSQLTVYQSQAP